MPPGSAMRFQTGSDVDAVAVEVAALDHDVTQIDADAQYDRRDPRADRHSRQSSLLEIDGALHRIDGAAELDKHAVASDLENAALMPGRPAAPAPPCGGPSACQRTGFVLLHEAAIADYVCHEDGRKAALNASLGHERQLLQKIEYGIICAPNRMVHRTELPNWVMSVGSATSAACPVLR